MRERTLPRPTGHTYNAILVVAVGALLAGVHHYVPFDTRVFLGFDHSEFPLHGLVTSAYVHSSAEHLDRNLQSYVLSSALAFGLCWRADEDRWFRRTVGALLLVLPVLNNLTGYVVYTMVFENHRLTTMGFSSVGAGFDGFGLVSFVVLYAKRYSRPAGVLLAVVTVTLLIWSLPQIYLDQIGIQMRHVGIIGLGIATVTIARTGVSLPSVPSVRSGLANGLFAVFVVAVLMFQILLLFPEGGFRGSENANIISHATGLVYGALIATGLKVWPLVSATRR